MARRDRPPIQRCLRRGDEIIVQIIKEGIGTKGPTLSTYLSIPGRILVMMPGMSKFGISRKIEDEDERRRLRQILDSLKPIKDVGFIIRTAGVGKAKTEIQRDLTYLTRLWQNINKKMKEKAPVELYTEGDLIARTVRDVFTSDVHRIVVDNKEVTRKIKEFIKILMPRTKNRVELYEEPVPIFHKYGIEKEIEQMYSRHVPLPSGGSLVIDSTEAIVAIDVNSGKFRDHADAETTAFKTDMEAADEIPRQLRLRDLGGVIICDFIDLRFERHRRELEKRLHDNLKNDRAKTKVLRMSQFGIIEMTRQRMRPSLKRSIYFDCPHCKGAGLVKTPESMSLDVMRRLAIASNDLKVQRVELSVCPDVAYYLLNKKRAQLTELETHTKKRIVVRQDPTLGLDEMKLELFDLRDGLVWLDELGMRPTEQQGLPGHRSQQQHGRRDDRRAGRPPQARRDERRDQPREEHDIDEEREEIHGGVEEAEDVSAPREADTSKAPTVAARAHETDAPDVDESEEQESSVIDIDDGPEAMGEGPRLSTKATAMTAMAAIEGAVGAAADAGAGARADRVVRADQAGHKTSGGQRRCPPPNPRCPARNPTLLNTRNPSTPTPKVPARAMNGIHKNNCPKAINPASVVAAEADAVIAAAVNAPKALEQPTAPTFRPKRRRTKHQSPMPLSMTIATTTSPKPTIAPASRRASPSRAVPPPSASRRRPLCAPARRIATSSMTNRSTRRPPRGREVIAIWMSCRTIWIENRTMSLLAKTLSSDQQRVEWRAVGDGMVLVAVEVKK